MHSQTSMAQRSMWLQAWFILGVCACRAAASRTLGNEPMMVRYHQWLAEQGRGGFNPDSDEEQQRFSIFKNNVEYIESANKAADRKFNLSINQFADLTNEEFKASRTGFVRPSLSRKETNTTAFKTSMYTDTADVPSAVDWRSQGAVTPIKNQGDNCACCWAFSAVAAMEGIIKIKTGVLVSFSEQELLDCDISGDNGNNGCNGGNMDKAFQFIMDYEGLTTEDEYPYEGTQGTCRKSFHIATLSDLVDVPSSESSLLEAVAKQPVSVAIDASGSDFRFYSGGIFTGSCGTNLNHAVTVVGYGAESDGTKYWLVKNSWGTSWGEDGYVKMQRDIGAAEGLCGITEMASYPIAYPTA